MKPMIILPPDTMSKDDIEQLRANGICVVESKDPSKVRFVDTIPTASNRDKIERASIKLSRIMLHGQWGHVTNSNVIARQDVASLFVHCLVEGTPLDRNGSLEEREEILYNSEKANEISRIAREDARAERKRKQEQKAAAEVKK